MSHDQESADLLNKEGRADDLQPKDFPSALALAREAEANNERSAFSTSYATAIGRRAQATEHNKNRPQNRQGKTTGRKEFKKEILISSSDSITILDKSKMRENSKDRARNLWKYIPHRNTMNAQSSGNPRPKCTGARTTKHV